MGKKSKKAKVPKTIAGVKLRKKHRKALGSVMHLLESPELRTALGALAGSFIARRQAKPESRDALH